MKFQGIKATGSTATNVRCGLVMGSGERVAGCGAGPIEAGYSEYTYQVEGFKGLVSTVFLCEVCAEETLKLAVIDSNLAIETLENEVAAKHSDLRDAGYQAFQSRMELPANAARIRALDDAISVSKDLTDVENDEYPHRWVRWDAACLVNLDSELEVEYLTEYLRDNYCLYLDAVNHAVTTSEGPCLALNEDGDLFDQEDSRVVIKRSEYDSDAKRDALIQAWMDDKGYYPSVVKYGRYGVEGYVSLTPQTVERETS